MDSINNTSKLGGDAWLELQAFKSRQLNRREKLNRHKDLMNGITTDTIAAASASTTINNNNTLVGPSTFSGRGAALNHNNSTQPTNKDPEKILNLSDVLGNEDSITSDQSIHADANTFEPPATISTALHSTFKPDKCQINSLSGTEQSSVNLEVVECLLLLKLCDVALKLPIDSKSLQRSICRVRGLENTSRSIIENLLEKFALQELVAIEEPSVSIINRRNNLSTLNDNQDDETYIYVVSADHTRLVDFDKSIGSHDNLRTMLIESKIEDSSDELGSFAGIKQKSVPIQSVRSQACASSSNEPRESSSKGVMPHSYRTLYNQAISIRGSAKNSLVSAKSGQPATENDLESLLSLSSTKERESKKLGEELLELLSKPSSKEKNLLESFRSADGYRVQEFCPKGTKDECRRNRKAVSSCEKLHFKKILAKHTEESLGDCSFLNTCFHMDSCKYVHYEVDYDTKQQIKRNKLKKSHANQQNRSQFNSSTTCEQTPDEKLAGLGQSTSRLNRNTEVGRDDKLDPLLPISTEAPASSTTKQSSQTEEQAEQARLEAKARKRFKTVLYPPQWIQCDLRYFDMSLLGKFSVVMADPPWDIHMELPYGTMSDDEMRKLNIPALQDDGVIFLWVTGRAMELGRECLALWGYERCDEIIWVKTNQLQRIIRTGRTGHWLNHGKEHCLVGIKGNPTDINRGLDCDIIVAEVRATSHKPDEIYGIIERLSPGTRKIELFGRAHNVQPNWITLGNQLSGVRLVEPNLIETFKKLNMPYQTGDKLS